MHAITLLSILALATTLTAGKIVDPLDSGAVEIARALCREGKSARLSDKRSPRLALRAFRSAGEGSELANCRRHYLKPLERLVEVLDASADNACTKEKSDAIEKFHWDYIVPALSNKWWAASREAFAPVPVRVFFMHYADEIADKCKDVLVDRLSVAAQKQVDVNQVVWEGDFHKSIFGVTTEVFPTKKVTNFDSFLLVWSQLVGQERRAGKFHRISVDERTKEPLVGVMRVGDPSKAWSIQRKCRHSLRPIYLNTVLPVMKLIEMGYGHVDEASKRVVGMSPLIAGWYAATQTCEAIIPIQFYADPSLKPTHMVLVQERECVEGLSTSADDVPVEKIWVWRDEKPTRTLENNLLPDAEDSSIGPRIKENIEWRQKSLRQSFKNLFHYMKQHLKSKFKKFFMRNGAGKRHEQEEGESGDLLLEQSEAEFAKEPDESGLVERNQQLEELNKSGDLSTLLRAQNMKLSKYQKVFVVVVMLLIICCTSVCPILIALG